jgi:hypothetical protein
LLELGETEAEGLRLDEELLLSEDDGLTLEEEDRDSDNEGEADVLLLAETEGLRDSLSEIDALGDLEGLADGEAETSI